MYQHLQIEEESDASNKHGLKQAPHGQSTGKYVNPIQRGDRIIPGKTNDCIKHISHRILITTTITVMISRLNNYYAHCIPKFLQLEILRATFR